MKLKNWIILLFSIDTLALIGYGFYQGSAQAVWQLIVEYWFVAVVVIDFFVVSSLVAYWTGKETTHEKIMLIPYEDAPEPN